MVTAGQLAGATALPPRRALIAAQKVRRLFSTEVWKSCTALSRVLSAVASVVRLVVQLFHTSVENNRLTFWAAIKALRDGAVPEGRRQRPSRQARAEPRAGAHRV